MNGFFRRLGLLFGSAFLFLPLTGCTQDLAWPAVLRSIRAEFPEVAQLSTDSLAAWLDRDTLQHPVLLLDTRAPEEYAISHLPGALRVDPEAEDFSFLDTFARDTPIVAYCSVGYRSSRLARRMQEAGFTNVSNLEGSIFQWANEGRPVYRGDEPVQEVHPYDAVWGRLLDAELRASEPDSR